MIDIERLTAPYTGHVPGCAIAVIKNGSLLLHEIHGYADLENEVVVTSNTNFRLASVSKHFTAAAILELCDRNLLSLEDTLDRYFPEFPNYGKRVTIKQLLTHTSGLVDYEELMDKNDTDQIHDREILELLVRQNHGYFEPGSTFCYSDGGYCLLALIVEQVSGESFASFMRSEIFIPLGMKNSFVNEEGITDIPNRAYGYSRQGTEWARTDQNATSATVGDGGIYSSISDLAIWDQALESRGLFEKQILTDLQPSPIYYGFGFFLKEYQGMQVQYHSGSSIGFRNGYYRVPQQGLTIFFLSNRNEGESIVLCEKIVGSVLTVSEK
jgi:CubicO group peptidase (beta-lactamase class C family)